ncbi:kinase subdomain-containing protein, partial [Zopfia rhizophila CBS 207.26]
MDLTFFLAFISFHPPKPMPTNAAQAAMEQALAPTQKQGEESNPVDTTGLCLLSLDGGGIRGLSALYILKGLMDQLNQARRAANLPPVKPCEIFDLIGGTSTGGLIAIMLGRLEMDVNECISAYSKLMKTVFEEKSSWLPVGWTGRTKAQFDSKRLKSAIEEVIGSKGASTADVFNNGKVRGCLTFVCTVAKETAGITRLRSYTLPDERDIPATICEAALATSAATGFFDPVSIGARQFVDGAFGANNPVDEVEGEAANIWCSETGDLKPLVKCFVSIGTGNPGKKAIEDNMFKFLSKSLVGIVTETEDTERKFVARWAKHFDQKRYFRFNVDQGLQDVGLAEYKEQGRVEAATDEYLRHQTQKFRVRDCVQNLQRKQTRTDVNFAAVMHEYMTRIIQLRKNPPKACWTVPFARNPQFVGRHSQLHRLQDTVFANEQPPKFAITGLGGVGKTQVVLELAYRTREKYPECSIFWIPATNDESLQQAYLDVGRQLGISGLQEEQADIKILVQRHLSQESTGQWLIIFDNADNMDMWINNGGKDKDSRGLKDYLPMSRQGCVVFTTRNRKIAVKLAQSNVIEVLEMDKGAAMQLLSKSLINQELLNDHQDALRLLQQLTFLPLAIVQAAAYINENGITLSDYLVLLEEQEQDVVDLLSEDFEVEGRYQDVKNPVATTWLISFEQIRRLDPLAAEYLSFMSCVDPKHVPQSLLPLAQSRKKETDAIGTLDAYSFVSRRPGDHALDVHRLVHLAMRNWLRREGSLKQWVAKTMKRLEEVFPDLDHKNRSMWRMYLAHARYVLKSDDIEEEVQGRTALRWKFALCLQSDRRDSEAEISF